MDGDSHPADDPRRHRYALHLLLFAATCVTTTWAGALYVHPEALALPARQVLPLLWDGWPFSLSLLAILMTHEMGHYVLARYHRVDVSLPYFIPLPFGMIGTMGAVIRMRGAIASRNALVDVGAAGPLAGLVVALPILAYGIHLSPVKPVGPGFLEGNSILYLALKLLIKGQVLPGGGLDVALHPVAWAGWVGLLVTMINLLPIGQLDGGHVAFAYFGARHDRASRWLHLGLLPLAVGASAFAIYELSRKAILRTALLLGVAAGLPWFVWWVLLTLMRRFSGGVYHPPVGEDALTPGRRRVCLLIGLVFLLILTPIPLRRTL
ncbi:MAG: site-2 protease family protein [Deltaproteobacteria bacterium]|nr:site-2 protease family protein [Deltaproteobacteria bacterium]